MFSHRILKGRGENLSIDSQLIRLSDAEEEKKS